MSIRNIALSIVITILSGFAFATLLYANKVRGIGQTPSYSNLKYITGNLYTLVKTGLDKR